MKKMFMAVLAVMAVLAIGQITLAEEILSNETEYQKVLSSLDELERGCPYSFSEEIFLRDFLRTMKEGFDAIALIPSLSKKDASQVSTIRARIEEILNGHCCQNIRSLEKVQEMLFDFQGGFKTPSAKQWWDGLD